LVGHVRTSLKRLGAVGIVPWLVLYIKAEKVWIECGGIMGVLEFEGGIWYSSDR
jgi:hypothetical protein